MKLEPANQPINLSPWVLFTNSATKPGVITHFLKKVHSSKRPFTRILEITERRYRYTVEFDLYEGLLGCIGLTAQGAAQVELIMKSFQHKTNCIFWKGNRYVYANYLRLEDSVEVANELQKLVGINGTWEKMYGVLDEE